MKVVQFFKILNKKINKYDKLATNPFYQTKEPVTIVWIEESKEDNEYDKNTDEGT